MRYSLTVFLVVVLVILAGIVTMAEAATIMEGDSAFIVENPGETVIVDPICFNHADGNIDYTESTFSPTNIKEDAEFRTVTEEGYGERVILYDYAVLRAHSEAYLVDNERLHIIGQALVSRHFSAYNTKLSGRRKADTVHRLRT